MNLSIEDRILDNLDDQDAPISEFKAVSGVMDSTVGFTVLTNLVRAGRVARVQVPSKGLSTQPLFGYKLKAQV